MGRKIPGKKHRGIKDPYKQQEVRFNKIKDKINRAPESVDTQEIPRRLQNITKFKKAGGKARPDGILKKKKKKKNELIDGTKFLEREKELPGMTRPTKLLPVLKQYPQESDKKFLRRVDRITKDMLKEAAFENKFQVDVMRDEGGNITSVNHREKNDPLLSEKEQLDASEREKRKRQARRERDFRRRHKNRRKKDGDDDDEFSYYQDEVEFGEVVYEPPTLDTEKLTRKVNDGITKPKKFLFMEKLKKSGDSELHTTSNQKKKLENQNLSVGRKRILEEERRRVVKAYQDMKASKYHTLSRS